MKERVDDFFRIQVPIRRAAVEEECGPSLERRPPLPPRCPVPPYFYAIFTPLSVCASEDLATADKLFPGALYISFDIEFSRLPTTLNEFAL